jgi:hypothetical protein
LMHRSCSSTSMTQPISMQPSPADGWMGDTKARATVRDGGRAPAQASLAADYFETACSAPVYFTTSQFNTIFFT